MSKVNINTDPVGYVLDMMWADLTKDGVNEALLQIRICVDSKDYERALLLALAVDLDRERRSLVRQQYGHEQPRWQQAAKLEQLAFLVRNLDKHRASDAEELPPLPIPPVPPPPMDQIVDEVMGPPKRALGKGSQ